VQQFFQKQISWPVGGEKGSVESNEVSSLFIYRYQIENLTPIQPVVSMKFLGDEETVRKAIESVAAQGKAK
jgi:hypothetical protein